MAALALLASGCGRPDPADRPQPPEAETSFAPLFASHCAGCHGADGRLGPAPPLNDSLFLAIVPDEVLEQIVIRGRPGTLMPAFAQAHEGDLTDRQVKALVAGIRRHWPTNPGGAHKALPPYLAPKAAGDVKAGAEAYARTCAMCHGEQGQGGRHAGPLKDRAFLALISDQALRRLIITGRPDLGMPAYDEHDEPLTDRDVTDVTALLASWRQEPGFAGVRRHP